MADRIHRCGHRIGVRLQEIVVEVSGMDGHDAENAVAAALGAVPGVQSVHVDARERRAVVTGDPDVAVPESLCAAIRTAGCTPGDVWFAE
jgi:copper chaperone CopZ